MAKTNKTIAIIASFIILLLLLNGCVDRSAAVNVCAEKNLQYTGKIFGSNIECINTTSGQLFRYAGKYEIVIKGG